MDRIVTFLLLLVSAILLIPGCIAEEQTVSEVVDEAIVTPAYNVTADVNTTELNMTLNQVAFVQLPENPTTGYSWNVTLSDGLTLLNETYVQDAAAEGMVGVGGVHEWYIEAIAVGNQTFDGIYKQPWEETVGNETTYSLAILVE
ncbi:protease inhibitor I42 family protein [Methanospirillum sp. J.3.6.1-F.2.7.3]|jgi:inhibitor of cysteine peptidase|uniref:Protease inhibitor I42 family protein n=1 Tax=Methanospirillum purgamenti TaxID=2834276 RepID=A0A8E7EHV6_9EURY|nr:MULTISPECIES: protease inhibitor I42 family protein [Methanospirillum]MDX8550619.1 protease inhibitor I42 family protein [Methanospirillum hungatei]NLW77601.1 protease inhibitor I42 family protein [Methanomicrobiales archaeon]QVV89773.1 protease inhibitor I42 family protein [Methanospirillum sp. J.3.6.1-F.2.7.3]